MIDDIASQVPPDRAMVVRAPAVVRSVEPPSSLDLWARALLMHRCFGEDDAEPNILRGLD
ncbi:hypothetical protein [Micromonospora auratinigra]|uniref:Uncharacterized protein n=1 Tax=Micromonospora auratinigra TaxID=261654 RepID=A0A1A8ZE29_9ACTN|nr:hypothetical protein [Micromonospora auratinigra]SBT42059.1 hypothetical protein GA0070611_1845 [Micromonospora auratinigra]